MAKSLGRLVYVFNCSSQMTGTPGQIFKACTMRMGDFDGSIELILLYLLQHSKFYNIWCYAQEKFHNFSDGASAGLSGIVVCLLLWILQNMVVAHNSREPEVSTKCVNDQPNRQAIIRVFSALVAFSLLKQHWLDFTFCITSANSSLAPSPIMILVSIYSVCPCNCYRRWKSCCSAAFCGKAAHC